MDQWLALFFRETRMDQWPEVCQNSRPGLALVHRWLFPSFPALKRNSMTFLTFRTVLVIVEAPQRKKAPYEVLHQPSGLFHLWEGAM